MTHPATAALRGGMGNLPVSRNQLLVGVLGLLAAVLLALIVRDIFFPPGPTFPNVRTATVQVGTVQSAVTGTGTLQPANQQNLDFRDSGMIKEIDVKVGDQVNQGQVLAKLDDAPFRSALQQAEGSLQTAEATLGMTVNGNAVQTAQHNLQAAQQALADTQNVASATEQGNQVAIQTAQRQVSLAQNQVQIAQQALEQAEAANPGCGTGLRYQTGGTDGVRLTAFHGSDAGSSFSGSSFSRTSGSTGTTGTSGMGPGSYSGSGVTPMPVRTFTPMPIPSTGTSTTTGGTTSTPGPTASMATMTPTPRPTPNCAAVTSAASSVNSARQALATQQANVKTAEANLNTQQANDQKSINQAQASVVSAQDALNTQTIDRPFTISQEEGSVASAAAQVQVAQQNLSYTVLQAPITGTVTALNGVVGEQISAGGGTTTLAPGTLAPQPTSSGATSTSSGTALGQGVQTTPLMVLSNVNTFQVVAPFAEGDAARVLPSQSADVTFDALPGVDIPAQVMSIAPGATVISNVTNYYVTLGLSQLDQRLKAGMTANASVIVNQVRNVLTVPNAAIQRANGQAFVNLLQANGSQRRVPVQVGTQGDTMTEIISGVSAGDRVVLPTVRVPTATPGGPGGGPGGGGGGGGPRGA